MGCLIVTFFRSQAFKLFDSDGDGIITSEELRALIEKVTRVFFIMIMIIMIIMIIISIIIFILIFRWEEL